MAGWHGTLGVFSARAAIEFAQADTANPQPHGCPDACGKLSTPAALSWLLRQRCAGGAVAAPGADRQDGNSLQGCNVAPILASGA